MSFEIEYEPSLLSVNLLYHVYRYLRGDMPLRYFRHWEVGMFLVRHELSVADACFLQRFEGLYAGYGVMEDRPTPNYFSRDEWLKYELHKLIGAPAPDLLPTGSASQNPMTSIVVAGR